LTCIVVIDTGEDEQANLQVMLIAADSIHHISTSWKSRTITTNNCDMSSVVDVSSLSYSSPSPISATPPPALALMDMLSGSLAQELAAHSQRLGFLVNKL